MATLTGGVSNKTNHQEIYRKETYNNEMSGTHELGAQPNQLFLENRRELLRATSRL